MNINEEMNKFFIDYDIILSEKFIHSSWNLTVYNPLHDKAVNNLSYATTCLNNFYNWLHLNSSRFNEQHTIISESSSNIEYFHVHFDFTKCYSHSYNIYFHHCLVPIYKYVLSRLPYKKAICFLSDTDKKFPRSKFKLIQFPEYLFIIKSFFNEYCHIVYWNSTVTMVEQGMKPACVLSINTWGKLAIGKPFYSHLCESDESLRRQFFNVIRDGSMLNIDTKMESIYEKHRYRRKIMIYSRLDGSNGRQILNGPFVAETLKRQLPDYDVQLVEMLHSQNYNETIALFAGADIVIAPHGESL